MAEGASLFMAYGFARRLLLSSSTDKERDLSYPELFVAGAISGFATGIVLTPPELIKCRVQVANAASAGSTSALREARAVLASQGVSGLFVGLSSCLYREVPGNIAYFGTYETVCRLLTPQGKVKKDLHPLAVMFAGACSGAMYWTAFYPADTVKTRLQTDASLQGRSFFHVLKTVYRNEGIKGLYKGWGVTALRAIPSNAFIFYTYELSMSMLQPSACS